jgi:hypothetical protein
MALVHSAAAVVIRVREVCMVAVLTSRIPVEVDDTLRQEARNVGGGCGHRDWLMTAVEVAVQSRKWKIVPI